MLKSFLISIYRPRFIWGAKMQLFFSFLFILVFNSYSNENFEGAGHIEVEYSFDVVLVSDSLDHTVIEQQIRNWLLFVQGQLGNEFDNSILLNDARIDFSTSNNDHQVVAHVRAIGAAKKIANLAMILPRNISPAGMRSFQQTYSSCSSYSGAEYWYYYKPKNCVRGSDTKNVSRVNLTMRKTAANSSGKSPEYNKIWEDNKLELTYLSGNESELNGSNQLLSLTSKKFGPGVMLRHLRFQGGELFVKEFYKHNKTVKINYFSIDEHIRWLGADFEDLLASVGADSDVIAYNGHAGLGENINYILNTIRLKPNRYYLFWLHACHPYAYLDQSIFNYVEKINPGARWSKHLDLMSNIRIGFFSFGSDGAVLVDQLWNRRSYAQLLPTLTWDAAVVGEEDNP